MSDREKIRQRTSAQQAAARKSAIEEKTNGQGSIESLQADVNRQARAMSEKDASIKRLEKRLEKQILDNGTLAAQIGDIRTENKKLKSENEELSDRIDQLESAKEKSATRTNATDTSFEAAMDELRRQEKRSANLKVERDNAMADLKEKSEELTAALKSITHWKQQAESAAESIERLPGGERMTKKDADALRSMYSRLCDQNTRLVQLYGEVLSENQKIMAGK